MNMEFDYDLTPDQWETLKALRLPASRRGIVNRSVVKTLIALQLATECEDESVIITSKGRSVLLRGSPRLWDLAA
jgi:hypothetical protein